MTGADRIGAWAHADYVGFLKLCEDACRLNEADPAPDDASGNLIGECTKQAVLEHVIYHDLQRRVPKALQCLVRAANSDVTTQFKFLRLLAKCMVACWNLVALPDDADTQQDKEREKDLRALDRIVKRLDSIKNAFEDPEDAKRLEDLIATALQNLGRPVWSSDNKRLPGKRQKPGPNDVPHSMLRFMAIKFALEIGFVEAAILLDITAATGIDLSEREAQRYCQGARMEVQKRETIS